MGYQNEKFIELLNHQYQWPAQFVFKFIVPKDRIAELSSLFSGISAVLRPSASGSYISATYELNCRSANEVISVYQKASSVKGLIAL